MIDICQNYQELYDSFGPEEKKNAPRQLFFEGDFSLLTVGTRVSVVGSRKVSDNGIKRTKVISKELVKRNITVVSGLAEGVDTFAHTTAINFGGKTISVLGTPLDKCFPSKNKPLLNRIKKEHLAISEFPLNSNTYPSNFPKRNKTMALISDATIIVEASEKSGTKHQGWEALRLGKPLMIMENVVKDKNLTWPSKMIDYGAITLTKENMGFILDEISFLSLF